MDPNRNTRDESTTHLLSREIPPNAAPEWRKLADNLRTLLDKLAHNPAMAPNLQQTYMTPAASKNNVYFMWDFVGRTLGMLYGVDSSLRRLSPQEQGAWKDARGRAVYAMMLITDAVPGKLNQMTESTYPGQKGQHPEFGEEILAIARRLEG